MNEHGSIRVLIIKRENNFGIQLTFPDAIADLLRPYVSVEGTLKTGLILAKALNQSGKNIFKIMKPAGATAYRATFAVKPYAGVPVSGIKAEVSMPCVILKEAGEVKVLLDGVDVSALASRRPRWLKKDNQQQQPALPLAAPKPAVTEPDEMEQLKQALAYIRSAGSRPLWQAIVTVFRLANKQHIRLRLTDEGLKATREVEV